MGRLRPILPLLSLLAFVAGSAPAAAQVDPKTALLEKAGWNALREGHAHDAADDFRQALDADPRNARLHLGAGVAAFLERRDADAKASLERALEIDPALTDADRVLGQVLHRSNDLPGAIRAYEALTAASPGDADAQATLERWRREAALADRMQQAIGSHFTVSFEGPAEAALAAEALASLDRAYWRVGSVLATYPNDPIPVVLYTTEQFRDITRSPGWAAGAFDGAIRVPMRGALEDPNELDRVLAHEFTHAVVRLLAPRGVPTWLNEGLATALEAGDLELGGKPGRARGRDRAALGPGRIVRTPERRAGHARLRRQRAGRAAPHPGQRRLRGGESAAGSRRGRRLQPGLRTPHAAEVRRLPGSARAGPILAARDRKGGHGLRDTKDRPQRHGGLQGFLCGSASRW